MRGIKIIDLDNPVNNIPHNWIIDGTPGLYDTNYICNQCNCSWTERMDSPETIPKLGCEVELPKPGQLWEHHNGKEYRVMHVANQYSQDLVKYPITIVYRGFNGRVWAKSLGNWFTAMTRKERSNVED